MRASANLGTCSGCGLERPDLDAPAPTDLAASAACWALYGQLLVRQYSLAVSRRVRRSTVAAYAVQHPARSTPQSIESVSLHLIELCLLLEHRTSAQQTTKLLASALERRPGFRWLEPPAPNGTVTVAEVLAAPHNEYNQVVECWARNVWNAWKAYHPTVRDWTERSLNRAGHPGTPPNS